MVKKPHGTSAENPLLKARALVTHPERGDEQGTVSAAQRAAWTPNNLTKEAPDEGMVKVHWRDSFDPESLYWEYAQELQAVR
ncbi:hypothetical protein [Mycobacteroides chelonae]|uniref:hypothetical protein n=1 Tax=Mycobacteroides chelonae TaxID=1774 RepID=UPI0008A8C4BE|nr:hypothetical protein [Mycobacteroides chelonae]OHU12872.1 hypothetical protein BKG75_17825 [Mycobacteroides chelonae]